MFKELQLPHTTTAHEGATIYYVPCKDDDNFLRNDSISTDSGDGDIEKYIFKSLPDAHFAMVAYYINNHRLPYPYENEYQYALKCITHTSITKESIESQVMEFE